MKTDNLIDDLVPRCRVWEKNRERGEVPWGARWEIVEIAKKIVALEDPPEFRDKSLFQRFLKRIKRDD